MSSFEGSAALGSFGSFGSFGSSGKQKTPTPVLVPQKKKTPTPVVAAPKKKKTPTRSGSFVGSAALGSFGSFGSLPPKESPIVTPKKLSTPLMGLADVEHLAENMNWAYVGDEVPYKLGKKIGSGSFGDAYEGTYNGKDVVIKFVQLTKTKSVKPAELAQEVTALKRLGENCSKYAAKFVDVLWNDKKKQVVLVMEKAPGSPLWQVQPELVKDRQRLLETAAYLIDGLKCIHANGILHRDIKNDNVMVSNGPQFATYIDFGLSCFFRDVPQHGQTCSGTRSSGAKRYWSPELLESAYKDRTEPDDIFALGVLLIEMVTGDMPHAPSGSNINVNKMREKIKEYSTPEGVYEPKDKEEAIIKNWIQQMVKFDPAERKLPNTSVRKVPSVEKKKVSGPRLKSALRKEGRSKRPIRFASSAERAAESHEKRPKHAREPRRLTEAERKEWEKEQFEHLGTFTKPAPGSAEADCIETILNYHAVWNKKDAEKVEPTPFKKTDARQIVKDCLEVIKDNDDPTRVEFKRRDPRLTAVKQYAADLIKKGYVKRDAAKKTAAWREYYGEELESQRQSLIKEASEQVEDAKAEENASLERIRKLETHLTRLKSKPRRDRAKEAQLKKELADAQAEEDASLERQQKLKAHLSRLKSKPRRDRAKEAEIKKNLEAEQANEDASLARQEKLQSHLTRLKSKPRRNRAKEAELKKELAEAEAMLEAAKEKKESAESLKEELEKPLTVNDLKQMCKEKKISVKRGWRKADLMANCGPEAVALPPKQLSKEAVEELKEVVEDVATGEIATQAELNESLKEIVEAEKERTGQELTVKDLKALCKEKKISVKRGWRKADLMRECGPEAVALPPAVEGLPPKKKKIAKQKKKIAEEIKSVVEAVASGEISTEKELSANIQSIVESASTSASGEPARLPSIVTACRAALSQMLIDAGNDPLLVEQMLTEFMSDMMRRVTKGASANQCRNELDDVAKVLMLFVQP